MSECDKDLIKNGLSLLEEKKYKNALEVFLQAEKLYSEQKSDENLSIALSFCAMTKYFAGKSNYQEVLKILNDADYMARYSKSGTAQVVNEYARGTVYYGEGVKDIALLHYTNAKNLAVEYGDELSLNVDEENNSISIDLAIQTAVRFGISEEDAKNCAEDIRKIVRENWEKTAADYGLTRRQIEEMRPAFSACFSVDIDRNGIRI